MSKANNASTTVAQLKGGTAERMIEDRAASDPLCQPDGQDPTVNRALVQATGVGDLQNVAQVMKLIDHLGTHEVEWQDRETGEIKVSNTRWFWKKMLMRSLIRQTDFLIEKQQERCNQADRAAAYAIGRQGVDQDSPHAARKEARAEDETDRLIELVGIRKEMAIAYAEYVGEPFDLETQPVARRGAVTPAAQRAAARAQALAALKA